MVEESTDLEADPPSRLRNETDYDFPPMWNTFTPEEKHRWFVRERVFRQAIKQDTAFGRRYRSTQSGVEKAGVDLADAYTRAGRGGYRYD